MQVSGIGAAGAAGFGAAMGGAAGANAAASGAGVPGTAQATTGNQLAAPQGGHWADSGAKSSLEDASLRSSRPAGHESLGHSLQKSPLQELLFTLIVLALLDAGDRDRDSTADALSLIAGLTLLAKLGEALGQVLDQAFQPGGGFGGAAGPSGVGMQLNVQA